MNALRSDGYRWRERRVARGSATALLTMTALVTVWLFGCAPVTLQPTSKTPHPDPTLDPRSLSGSRWLLERVDGNSPEEGAPFSLDFFPEDYVEGDVGCNRYGSNYTSDGSSFRLGVIHRTDFDCELSQQVRQMEAVFLNALARTSVCRGTDERLELADSSGQTILIFSRKWPATVDSALLDSEWLLQRLGTREVAEGARISLNFSAEGVDGYTGCNLYGGAFQAADRGSLVLDDVWQTAVGCASEGLAHQEQAYVDSLARVRSYQLSTPRLVLLDNAQQVLLEYLVVKQWPMDPNDLIGSTWQLNAVDGEEAANVLAVTLAFHDRRLGGGFAGCDDYLFTYDAAGDDLHFLYLGMFGPDSGQAEALQIQQSDYTTLLGDTTDYRIEDERLQLLTRQGRVLTFTNAADDSQAELEGPTWSLIAFARATAIDGETEVAPSSGPLLGSNITAQFSAGELHGFAGCSKYTASYIDQATSLSVGQVDSRGRECLDPEGAMDQEMRYLDLLRAVTGYHIYSQQLWLETDNHRLLIYTSRTLASDQESQHP